MNMCIICVCVHITFLFIFVEFLFSSVIKYNRKMQMPFTGNAGTHSDAWVGERDRVAGIRATGPDEGRYRGISGDPMRQKGLKSVGKWKSGKEEHLDEERRVRYSVSIVRSFERVVQASVYSDHSSGSKCILFTRISNSRADNNYRFKWVKNVLNGERLDYQIWTRLPC